MATTRKTKQAEILREYGPYPGIDQVHGVTFDGAHVWFARGETIVAIDPVGGGLVNLSIGLCHCQATGCPAIKPRRIAIRCAVYH